MWFVKSVHKFWFCNFAINIGSFSYRVHLLLRILLDEHFSGGVYEVTLNLRSWIVKCQPVFPKDVVVEVFLLLSDSRLFFAIFTISPKVLDLIRLKFRFLQNCDGFVLSRISSDFPKQIYSFVFWRIVENLSALKQVEIYFIRILADSLLKFVHSCRIKKL